MNRRFVLVIATAAILALLLPTALYGQKGHPNTRKWKDLFAKDLSYAVMGPGSWAIEDGILTAKDRGTIWTKQSYGDFTLDLEFKVEPAANSGIFLRASDIKRETSALEIQVHETTDGSKYGMVGALYDAMPPSKSMAKPAGEWNRFTITCKGSLVSVVFNGAEVIKADLENWKEARKNPDGTPNKFSPALKDFARVGPVGIQGIHGKEGHKVWYRNVKIRELK